MSNSKLDTFIRPIVARLHANHISRLGIANTTRLAYFNMPHKVYPIRDTDSRLRKIVLNKSMLE